MKNFISLLIITFSLLIISNVESYAQCNCPSYSTQTSITMFYNGDPNCPIIIDYCYYQHATGVLEIELCSWTIVNPLGCNILLNDLFNQMYDNIFSNAQTYYSIPPCDPENTGNYFVVEVFKASCWAYNIISHPESPNSHQYIPCGLEPGECTISYSLCWGPNGLEKTLNGGPYVLEAGSCDNPIGNELPPNPYDCFNVCNY